MDHRKAIDILSGRQRSPWASVLRSAFWTASKPYSALMRVRRWAYRVGICRSHVAAGAAEGGKAVPVISIGNLTTGGTGKTPMVALMVNHLKTLGRRPGIVMRGYKASGGISDEAEMLAQLCNKTNPPVPIVTQPDRVAGTRQAIAQGADVIVLDDGFQHRRLRRDLDIVLIDATEPFGLDHCLPRGLLREPLSALGDADAIVITRSDCLSPEAIEDLRKKLKKLAPHAGCIALAAHRPLAAIDEAGQAQPAQAVAGQKFYAFCGIGNPGSFFDSLTKLGARLGGARDLGDHCEYSPHLLENLASDARERDCPRLITTQKDYVKIAGKIAGALLPMPLWQLAVEMDIQEGKETLLAQIESTVAGKTRPVVMP